MKKEINIVTVIGANGTMGANISGIFASFGDAKVYMVCRDKEKAENAKIKAGKSVRAESIMKNLVPTDYSELEQCVAESDLIFETVAENLEIKLDITKRIAQSMRDDAIVCSGTSGLSVTALSECLPDDLRSRYMGMHFFNPPYNMTLCEVIPTKYADEELLDDVVEYLRNVLRRTVVLVKDSPAFLANRIGFQFINEVMRAAETYKDKGGIDYIDAIFGTFTGRAMAPLNTADFVGLDIHKAIVSNLYDNTDDYAHDTFALPCFVEKLIIEGKFGRKAGSGLYKSEVDENGNRRLMTYDIASDDFRVKGKYDFPFARIMNSHLNNGDYKEAFEALLCDQSDEAILCVKMLLKYIVYGLSMSKKVGFDIHSADAVMATGFNWCPPLAMVDAFSTVCDFRTLVNDRLKDEEFGDMDLSELFENIESSRYDYRPYFKAGK